MTVRELFCWVLWRTGIATIARGALTRRGRFVVELHGVAGDHHAELPPEVPTPFTASDLKRTLAWIAGRFAFLSTEEFLTGERTGVLLTFDDGFSNLYDHALPVLEAFEAPAVFFVTAQHVRDPRDWLPATREQARALWGTEDQVPEAVARDLFDGMSREQLRACAEHPLVTIGSHTVHHPFLTRCDDATLASELAESKRLLELWSGQAVDLFAYPSGDYDRRVTRAVEEAGYRAAFVEDTVGAGSPAYEIPRVGLYASDPAYLALKLSGLHRPSLPPQAIPRSHRKVAAHGA